jgi:2-isopropylmalate synthase
MRQRQPPQPPSLPIHKYRPYEPFGLPDRTWPGRVADRPPIWCSVDLRDGNQALIDPMGIERKRRLFDLLVDMGFKEIEVGYPVSSQADWDFTRDVIERDAVPDDVIIQVMTPIRDELIERTVRVIEGARRAILQIYNPTSELQRRIVLRMSRDEVKALALRGAEHALRLRDSLHGTDIHLQYATESFSQTEPEFALEVCNAVLERLEPTPEDPIRIVFPATVECYPPQEFADRIEWMHRHLEPRDAVLLTVHPHNDRGTGVAATEMALLAGAQRVEGTLFGNGERAGNADIVTLAMNLFSQGIDPQLNLSQLDEIRRVAENCYGMPIPPRHPWAGDLVYTSFAGPHQDAISKGLAARAASGEEPWEVPYLPIDPHDVGRDYQALIRITSQSGKGGVAYLMRTVHGLDLPRRLQIELAWAIQAAADEHGREVTPDTLWDAFAHEYLQEDLCEYLHGGQRRGGEAPEALVSELLAPSGLPGALLELHRQPTPAPAGDSVVYAEVRAGGTVRWGVGIADDAETALTRALRCGVRRAVAAAALHEHRPAAAALDEHRPAAA